VSKQVKQFHQQVLQNRLLKEQLQAAADFNSFIHLAVKMGEENGYTFTHQEAERYVNQNILVLMRQFS
jgi:Nif11 domain